jgi:hypothetical protein
MLAIDKICKLCGEIIQSAKAQTRYCPPCAIKKKKENTEDSWLPAQRREYMRLYMRKYRRSHPKRNRIYVRKHRQKKREINRTADKDTNYFLCVGFLPILLFLNPIAMESVISWFDSVKTIVTYIELIVINLTGLVIVVKVCLQHIKYPVNKRNEKSGNDRGG